MEGPRSGGDCEPGDDRMLRAAGIGGAASSEVANDLCGEARPVAAANRLERVSDPFGDRKFFANESERTPA